jgi:hypothetical protein
VHAAYDRIDDWSIDPSDQEALEDVFIADDIILGSLCNICYYV